MAPLRPLLLSLLRLFCLSFFLFFAHSHLPPVLHLSFIHSQLFSSLSFVYCHLLSSVSFFVCSFIPTFCFFFFYPLFFFFIQSHLLWILFVSFVHSHLLFCSVSFLFVGSLAPSFILFRFFVHSHLLPILSFVYLHLPSYIRTFFLFCFFPSIIRTFFLLFHSFAPSFFYASFLCCVPHLLYPVYFLHSFTPSFYFERFGNSVVLSLLCCVDSFRHCFCVVYFLTSFAPSVCSPVRLPLFENPSSKQRKFAKLHLYNSSAETTSVISQDYNTISAKTTSVSAKKDKDAFPPLRTVTSQFPLPPCAGHAPFLPAPARGGF